MRLDLCTAECVDHVRQSGGIVPSPVNVTWHGEECHVSVFNELWGGHTVVAVYRDEDGKVKIKNVETPQKNTSNRIFVDFMPHIPCLFEGLMGDDEHAYVYICKECVDKYGLTTSDSCCGGNLCLVAGCKNETSLVHYVWDYRNLEQKPKKDQISKEQSETEEQLCQMVKKLAMMGVDIDTIHRQVDHAFNEVAEQNGYIVWCGRLYEPVERRHITGDYIEENGKYYIPLIQ